MAAAGDAAGAAVPAGALLPGGSFAALTLLSASNKKQSAITSPSPPTALATAPANFARFSLSAYTQGRERR
jgi:hypothetical protein